MSLASRVARLVRANFSARFGVTGPKEAEAFSGPYGEGGEAEPSPEPPPHPVVDPALARLYANLELPYGADREAVRAARRRLLSRYHPDRFMGDPDKARLATDLVQKLNHAHDELLKHLDKENPHG